MKKILILILLTSATLIAEDKPFQKVWNGILTKSVKEPVSVTTYWKKQQDGPTWLVKIAIKNGENPVQEINIGEDEKCGVDIYIQPETNELIYDEKSFITFEDKNKDSFNDLLIVSDSGSVVTTKCLFLYDKKTKNFKFNKYLEEE